MKATMKKDFVSRGRSVSDLKAHLVLTTKYRRKVFTEAMKGAIERNCSQSVSAMELQGYRD